MAADGSYTTGVLHAATATIDLSTSYLIDSYLKHMTLKLPRQLYVPQRNRFRNLNLLQLSLLKLQATLRLTSACTAVTLAFDILREKLQHHLHVSPAWNVFSNFEL